MTSGHRLMVGVAGLLVMAGCRTAAQAVQEPRVDLGVMEGGNRGYLIGTPPAATASKKSTRQMIQTDIELPIMSRATQPSEPETALSEPEVELSDSEPAPAAWTPPAHELVDTYTVKPGDTLWSIAADPAVYGNGAKWRKIFNANRNVLKNANRVPHGVTLRIPRDDNAAEASERQTEPTYSK